MNDPACPCAEFAARPYRSVSDAIVRVEDQNRLFPHLIDRVVQTSGVDMWVCAASRCGACGQLWGEACYSSGHMEVYYHYPVPGDDPATWLRTGRSLPRP